MTQSKPNACIKVASKPKAGTTDRYYSEIGAVWVDPVHKNASVKLYPGVTITEGLVMMTAKDASIPLAGRLNVVVTESIGIDEAGKTKLLFHTVGSAFPVGKGNYSLVLPVGVGLSGTFYLYENKEKSKE